MPFKKDTTGTLQNTQQITENRQQPLSQEGLNSSNLSGFTLECDPNELGITEQERQRRLTIQQQRLNQSNTLITQTQQNIQNTLIQQQQSGQVVNRYGLVIPTVENIPKPPDQLTPLDESLCNLVIVKIWDCIVYNKLWKFFTVPTKDERAGKCSAKTPQQRLQDIVNRATMHDYQILMELYKIPTIDQATDISVLALFDVIELIDDSTSMKTTGYRDFLGNTSNVDYDADEKDPVTGIDHNTKSRWHLAEDLVKLTSYTLTLFDDDGISVRFLNKDHRLLPKGIENTSLSDNVTLPDNIKKLFSVVSPNGGTAIGGSIKRIFEELVEPDLRAGTLSKPVLLIVYTDGESGDEIKPVIRFIRQQFRNSPYLSRGMLFSFNQVGRDKGAQKMLSDLDNDEVIVRVNGRDVIDPDAGAGAITDCTSAYKDEKEEYDKKQAKLPIEARINYSSAFHIIKGMVGPAIEKYDKSDEDDATTGTVAGAVRSVFGF